MRVEIGNSRPHEYVAGTLRPLEHGEPAVTYVDVPDYPDRDGNPLYSFPDDPHDDTLPGHVRTVLAGVSDENKAEVRRALIDGAFAHPSGVRGLPDHAAFAAIAHPQGVWARHAQPGDTPDWVWSDHPGMQRFLAAYFGCPEGRPANLEDRYWTRYGAGTFRPGAIPDPLSILDALHTSWGRDNQAITTGGVGYVGVAGVATATGATSLTSAAIASIGANAAAGQYLFAGPNTSGAGSTVYGLIMSHTSGTTPVFTVDQWYSAATPGGAAGTTPNATASYLIPTGGPPAQFAALSTDTTAKSLGGSDGTADASAITVALSGEISAAGGGLNRKIGVLAHSAGAATWTNTPVFTANGSDVLPKTVGTAALSPSNVAKALHYMTLLGTTAVLSASGDQLTLTWTLTMT